MRIVLFGDTSGINELYENINSKFIKGIVGASIREQYIDDLKKISKKINVPLLIQPKKNSENYQKFKIDLKKLEPDLIWINSYSMILSKEIFEIPKFHTINIHSSLLPFNRGCHPIQYSILNHDSFTGVTLHKVDGGIDTGPIINQRKVKINFDDTWIDLKNKITVETVKLIKESEKQIITNKFSLTKQNNSIATYGKRRFSDDSEFFWSDPILDIYNKIRSLLPPLPSAFFYRNNCYKFAISSYLTIWDLLSLREKFNKNLMKSKKICIKLFRQKDQNFFKKNYKMSLSRSWEKKMYKNLVILNKNISFKKLNNQSKNLIFIVKKLTNNYKIGICHLNINWQKKVVMVKIDLSKKYDNSFFFQECLLIMNKFCQKDLLISKIDYFICKKYKYKLNISKNINLLQ